MACCGEINVGGYQVSQNNRAFIENIIEILRRTERDGLLSDRRAEGLSGLSGLKTVGLLQRLARLFENDDQACYLEIGVFQGLTLVSAAIEAPSLACFGIDNFATLDPQGENLGIVRQRMNKFATANATLINQDFEKALESLDKHIGKRKLAVYFVDGPHDYRSQLICLLLAKKHLHENAIIIIDDANYADVRWSTRDFLLGHPEFKMLFEAYSPAHPANLGNDEKKIHEAGWLNGVNVLVRDTDGLLDDMLPPTKPDERQLYLNEWLAHRLRLAELAPQALALADNICRGEKHEQASTDLLERYAKNSRRFSARYPDRNTYSNGLSEGRFNGFQG